MYGELIKSENSQKEGGILVWLCVLLLSWNHGKADRTQSFEQLVWNVFH